MVKYKIIRVSVSCIYKGNFDIFKCFITNDQLRHFDTLIQTMKRLYIIFKTIGGLCRKTLNKGISVICPYISALQLHTKINLHC